MTEAAMPLQVMAVAIGAAFGALLRWATALWLNDAWGGFPVGTLLVNCSGGFLVGLAVCRFSIEPNELLRLLLVTGFLGGLTTFSTFSAESLILLQRGRWALALGHTLAHVLGALGAAALGFWVMKLLMQR